MFTGERILPHGKYNVTFQQSLFAYQAVRERAVGRRVLDVGSGEGYGSAYLAEAAKEVVGLDYSARANREAGERYPLPNLHFVTADIFDLPASLKEQRFDLVCSFQVIEHMRDQDRFLEVLGGLLSPGGTAAISTLNRLRFTAFNPFHVREFSPTELEEIMKRHFRKVTMLGVFGDEKILAYRSAKQKLGERITRLDVFQARRWMPNGLLRLVYGFLGGGVKALSYAQHRTLVDHVDHTNFYLNRDNLDRCLDVLVLGEEPYSGS